MSIEYYLSLIGYYAGQGEPPGQWFGAGAAALGLTGTVQAEALRQVFAGFHPTTSEPLVQNPGTGTRCPGHDLCMTATKAWSVLWSAAQPKLRARIEQTQQAVVESVLSIVEKQCAFSRVGKAANGCRRVAAGIAVATFQHGTSRANDPNLHTHCLILNVGVDSRGKPRTIESHPIFKDRRLLDAYFNANLAATIRRDFGLIAKRRGHAFTIKGIPDALLQAHSKRSQQIRKRLAELGTAGAKAAALAALETRAKKDRTIHRDQLFQQWRDVNRTHGFTARKVARLMRRGNRTPTGSITEAISAAVRNVTRSKNHFSQRELLIESLLALTEFGLFPEAMPDAVGDYLRTNPEIVALPDAEGEPRYTTREILALEQAMLADAEALAKRPGVAIASKAVAKSLTQSTPQLNEEQNAFVRHITQAASSIRIGQGLAGTGKTTALKTCVALWQSKGYRVLGAAPTGKAARILADSIGIECQTLTKLLGDYRLPASAAISHHIRQLARAARKKRTRKFRQPEPVKITSKTVIVLDESGMIGTHHMQKLLRVVEKGKGTLCLIGDPAQLPAVEGTSPLQSLARRFGSADLRDIRRQRDEWAREASKHFADGEPGKALELFAERGLLVACDDIDQAIRRACLDWKAEGIASPQRVVILTNTNDAAEQANALCQQFRIEAGYIRPDKWLDITDQQDAATYRSRVHVGDRILFTKNSVGRGKDRYGVCNGDCGVVIGIHPVRRVIDVRLDGGRVVAIPVHRYPHLRIAYAMTTFKAQGDTLPKVHVVTSNSGSMQNLPASYVQATRAIEQTKFYTTKAMLETAGDGVATSALAQQMSRRPDLRLASDLLSKDAKTAEKPQEPAAKPAVPSRKPRPLRKPTAPPAGNPKAPSVSAAPAEQPKRPVVSRPQPPATQTPQRKAKPQPIPSPARPAANRKLPPAASTPVVAQGNRPAANSTSANTKPLSVPPTPAQRPKRPVKSKPRPPATPPAQQPAEPRSIPVPVKPAAYQRLRVAPSTRVVVHNSLLEASCVDGGTIDGIHRPPPPDGQPLLYVSPGVVARQLQPFNFTMPLEQAMRSGELTLLGTGGEDYVRVKCRVPIAHWEISVPDDLCMASMQDDISEADRVYNNPRIREELRRLDLVERQLLGQPPTVNLLSSLFTLCRRLISWRLPNCTNPQAISQEMLRTFYHLLFQDPTTGRVLEWFRRHHEQLDAGGIAGYLQRLNQPSGAQIGQVVGTLPPAERLPTVLRFLQTRADDEQAVLRRLPVSAGILAQAAGLPAGTRPLQLPPALAVPFRFEQNMIDKWYPAMGLKNFLSGTLAQDPKYLESDVPRLFLHVVNNNVGLQ